MTDNALKKLKLNVAVKVLGITITTDRITRRKGKYLEK